jgi:DNA-directed RNA polymerase specialized sigma24 family protein
MLEPKSVTQWIEDLKQGDSNAAAQLWQRYFEKMVWTARKKLGHYRLGVADEEDVALSAFDSLCRGAANGNFTRLTDRHDLWPLLLTITAQKSIDRIRWETRQRRGGREQPQKSPEQSLEELLSQEPTPDFLLLMEEQCARLLSLLRDDTLRAVVRRKLEGYTNEQIAQFLDISVHAIGRKLRMIRLAWFQELDATT